MARGEQRSYEIVFPLHYEGQWEEECSFKGWLSGVIVRFEKKSYQLTFVDVHRLLSLIHI